MAEPPQVIVIAGPNGAGKSTCAAFLVSPSVEFVNADEIARRLGPASPAVDVQAGRLMLERLDALEAQRTSFALETTLANRSLVQRLSRLRNSGYRVQLFYVWIPNADLAVERVAERVRRGGHDVPEATIRRRFRASMYNFFHLYRPAVSSWGFLANLGPGSTNWIAQGSPDGTITVIDSELWRRIQKEWGNE